MDSSTQQSSAAAASASTDPAAADLSARFRAMQLIGDSSSPQPPSHRHPQPQSQPRPTAMAVVPRQLELSAAQAAPYHPQTQPQSYGVGESSTGAGHIPHYASSSFYASHFGAHSPRFSAASIQPVATQLLGAGAGQLDNPSVPHPWSMPSSSTNHFIQPMPMDPHPAAAAAYAWGEHGSIFNPYASAFQSTLLASQVGYYRSWVPTPAPTLAQVRSRLLRRPMEHALLDSPVTSAHVARLLEDGDERARRSVLASFKSDVRVFVGSTADRQAVVLALVRACMGRPDEVQDIVRAVLGADNILSAIAKHNQGLTTMKELIRAVAVAHPQLVKPLICWLIREHLMEQYKGAELLEHCFITMPYDQTKILIQFATKCIPNLLFSAFGSRCLAQCFVYARNKELQDLVDIILAYTTTIATGQYSNYFLQRVIECGSAPLQVAITERVAAAVLELSSNQFGSYVVESCFLYMRTPEPLQLVLDAFLALPRDDLAELVRGGFSNYAVSKLLDAAKDIMPSQARALAEKIQRLPAGVHREMHARGVMAVVKKLIQRQPRFNY